MFTRIERSIWSTEPEIWTCYKPPAVTYRENGKDPLRLVMLLSRLVDTDPSESERLMGPDRVTIAA